MAHLDKNGAPLAVGDTVRWGRREGTILILETWPPSPFYPREGVYVSGIGDWSDCRAVPARNVERVASDA
jgi:hypothetical protein